MLLYSSYSDARLCELLAKGDDGAFTEIYNRYWEKLFSVAANKLQDVPLAEELVQDIFLDIWNRRQRLAIDDLGAYLAVAMKYKVIDARQKRSRAQALKTRAGGNLSIVDDSTRQHLSFEDLKGRLAALVAALPEKCRLVYQLSREAGLSQKEIAGALDISEKTVESHITRAVKALKTGLNHVFTFFW